MSPLHPTAVEWSLEPAGAFESLDLAAFSQHAITLEPSQPVVQVSLREPSSLMLALVGVVTLAVFRGIQKRVTGQSENKGRDLIKPRRRAA